MHLPIVSNITTKATPPTTTVMSATIAPPPRHWGRRRFLSELYELFYVHKDPKYPDEIIHYAPSLSHQFVWKKLLFVQPNCRKLLIQDLADTYGYNHFQANYTCSLGHVTNMNTAKTDTTQSTSALKTTIVQTQHHNHSSHTTGHVASVTTAKTHTTVPSITLKTTIVQPQHQNISTHTTGHVISVSTANMHTTMPSTTPKTTMVQTQHQNLTTHTTGHVTSMTAAKTHTTQSTTALKTTMVQTQHQNLTTHTTGHIISVTHTTMPSSTMKTTMVQTQYHNPSNHTTGHIISVTHTTMPSSTMKTTMVQTQHHNPSNHTTVVTVPNSSTVPHIMSPAVTMHTTSSVATTTYANCNAQDLTYGIQHQVVLSPSSNCLSIVFHSEEIFNAYCTISHILWTPGPKVLDMCQSLPNNTAVATFVSGTFDPNIDIAAIFMGCIDSSDGFRAAIALCNSTIIIQDVTIDNAPFFHSPDQYYVVRNVEG
ncbi:hypothetical protein CHS0354_018979 [Potamilus streckersoni]|uniref:Uncharacterized protein n=1 Tax=Potamilus streckersoni TaxID=2493646 RepID=A0AAE0VZ36_9BIVA|nr:hypothetical protein CHS0354_018979 [Potamilus streckersoni]